MLRKFLDTDTDVDNSVAVDEPHDSRSRVAGDSAAEASRFSFHSRVRLWLRYEWRLLSSLLLFLRLFRSSAKQRLSSSTHKLQTVKIPNFL